MSLIPGIIAFGLYSACLYAIGAVGFTLQFGVTNVLNLAYGAILTSAMYIDYALGHGSPRIWVNARNATGGITNWRRARGVSRC